MRIVFVTRRYPPSIGGIQTFAFHLQREMAKRHPVRLIALRADHPIHLAWFAPLATLRVITSLARGADVVYFADGVIASLAPILRPFRRNARFVATVHGLEATYSNRLVRRVIKAGLKRCDTLIAASENTRHLMMQAGFSPKCSRVIYCGVEPPTLDPAAEQRIREQFVARTGIRLGTAPVLLNIGRQVKRKGLAEFLTDVLPNLAPTPDVVICGTGPEHARLQEIAAASPHRERIHLVGRTDDATTTMLRRACSLFVMPNISVDGDAEGFGIAPLEAMYYGLPVVGFGVDALPESLREGAWLIPAGDPVAFADCINRALSAPVAEQSAKREEARAYVSREYGWADVADRYLEAFPTD